MQTEENNVTSDNIAEVKLAKEQKATAMLSEEDFNRLNPLFSYPVLRRTSKHAPARALRAIAKRNKRKRGVVHDKLGLKAKERKQRASKVL